MNQQKADEGSFADVHEKLTEYRGNQDDDVIVIHDDDSEDEEENVKVNKSREKTIDEHASIILRHLLNSSHFKMHHEIDGSALLSKYENGTETSVKKPAKSGELPEIPEYIKDYDDDRDTVVNGEINQSLESNAAEDNLSSEKTRIVENYLSDISTTIELDDDGEDQHQNVTTTTPFLLPPTPDWIHDQDSSKSAYPQTENTGPQTPEQSFHAEETEPNCYQYPEHYRHTPHTNNAHNDLPQLNAITPTNSHVKLRKVRPFTCNVCGRHTGTENSMILHYHFHHWKKSGFAVADGFLCPKCGIFYKNKYSLLRHMERKHPPIQPTATIPPLDAIPCSNNFSNAPWAAPPLSIPNISGPGTSHNTAPHMAFNAVPYTLYNFYTSMATGTYTTMASGRSPTMIARGIQNAPLIPMEKPTGPQGHFLMY